MLSLLYFVAGSNSRVAALAAVQDAVIAVAASTPSSVAVVTVTILAAGLAVVDETIAFTEAVVDAHMFCEIRPFQF
jgi:hypothetical protein